jgi:hypothetical protein
VCEILAEGAHKADHALIPVFLLYVFLLVELLLVPKGLLVVFCKA